MLLMWINLDHVLNFQLVNDVYNFILTDTDISTVYPVLVNTSGSVEIVNTMVASQSLHTPLCIICPQIVQWAYLKDAQLHYLVILPV